MRSWLAGCSARKSPGARISAAALDGICQIAAKYGAWVLSDEIYRGAELDGVETSSVWGRYDRVIVTSGLSKAYGLPGLRIGWIVSTPPVVALRGVPGSEPDLPDGRAPLWLNMWSAVSDQLVLAGLAAENVHVARLCTSCARDVFHSYRVDGPAAGRMVGVIRVGPTQGPAPTSRHRH